MTTLEIILLISTVFSFVYIIYSHRKILKKETTLNNYISIFIDENIENILENEHLKEVIKAQSAKHIQQLRSRIQRLEIQNGVYSKEIRRFNEKIAQMYETIKDLTDERIKLKQENRKLQNFQ